MSTTYEVLKPIIVEQMGIDPNVVTLEARLIEDLGADSLDIVELTMHVEEQFNLGIPDDKIESIKTVGDLVKIIDEQAK